MQYFEVLYEYYSNDFIYSTPEFLGKPVYQNSTSIKDGKEESFWHILQGEHQDQIAEDMGRHKRIRWVRAIIDNAEIQKLKCWRIEETKKGRKRTKVKISLDDFSYIVILGEKKKHYVLITGFPIDRPRIRDSLRKEWEKHKFDP